MKVLFLKEGRGEDSVGSKGFNYNYIQLLAIRAERYTGIKLMLRYFVHTDIDIKQIFLYRNTVKIPIYNKILVYVLT